MALVWAQGANNLDSVRKLKSIVAQETPESYLASYLAGQIAFHSMRSALIKTFPTHLSIPRPSRYSLPKTMQVRLAIYDLLGQVTVLTQGQQEAGIYSQEFNGDQLPPGMYFARIELDHLQFTKKLVKLSGE